MSNIRNSLRVEPKILVAQEVTSTVSAAIYTCPAGSSVKVSTATVCNDDLNTTRTFYVVLYQAGANVAIPVRVAVIKLNPLESCVVPELVGVMLGPGDRIGAACQGGAGGWIALSGVVASSTLAAVELGDGAQTIPGSVDGAQTIPGAVEA